jgi:hypothetical protein
MEAAAVNTGGAVKVPSTKRQIDENDIALISLGLLVG